MPTARKINQEAGGTINLPAACYSDPTWYALDREHVLAPNWHYVGPSSELAEAGRCLPVEIAGWPILLIRQSDGDVRGFFNICRHRGGPLVDRPQCLDRLRCRYHGWLYGLDGRLLGRPQWPQDSATARASLGLEAVEVREWLGMVFVRMRAGGPAFDAWIEGLAERVAPIDPGDMQFARREVYRVGANWKVYADNFLEAYHLPLVHPEYATTLDRSGYRYELAEHYSVQCSPFSDTPGYYGRLRDASAGDEAFYAFLFPVCMLNILPGRMQVNAIRPLGVHACEVIFDYYYAQDAAGADTQLVDEDSRVSARIQEEDREICEAVQRAMNSGAYRPGPLSPKEEPAVRHFQQRLRHIYRQQGASCE